MQRLPVQQRAAHSAGKCAKPSNAKRGMLSRCAVTAPKSQADSKPDSKPQSSQVSNTSNTTDIYVGKGRFIKDDPKKYPAKEDAGLFKGVVGGWAGGEEALWKFREEMEQAEASAKKTASKEKKPAAKAAAPKTATAGKEVIYIGIDKEESLKTGIKGKFIVDDPRKYPGKEDLGPLVGAAGGFAGGEAGLKQFVETGELNLRPAGQPERPQTSPVAKAGIIIAAGAGGGLLLNSLFDEAEEVVKDDIVQAPIDENTKTLLLVALGLLAAVGTIAGGRALLLNLQQRVSESANTLVTVGAFWLVIFCVARAVLEL